MDDDDILERALIATINDELPSWIITESRTYRKTYRFSTRDDYCFELTFDPASVTVACISAVSRRTFSIEAPTFYVDIRAYARKIVETKCRRIVWTPSPSPTDIAGFRLISHDLRRQGKTPEQAAALHEERQRMHDRRKTEGSLPRICGLRKHLIPLGTHDLKPPTYSRAHTWQSSQPDTEPSHVHVSQDARSPGRWKSYSRHIECWAVVKGGHLFAKIDTDAGLATAYYHPWRGWYWKVNSKGICLTNSTGRQAYYPTATDLLANRTTREVARLSRKPRTCQSRQFASTTATRSRPKSIRPQ